MVDTTQILNIPNYTNNLIINEEINNGDKKDILEYSELSKKSLEKYYQQSKDLKKGYALFIVNESDSIFELSIKEGWLKMIQEAKNEKGIWKPIEYYDPRAICGNSFKNIEILPKYYAISAIYKYSGNFKTKKRIKLNSRGNNYYSNEFNGYINKEQFNVPIEIEKKEEKKKKRYFLSN